MSTANKMNLFLVNQILVASAEIALETVGLDSENCLRRESIGRKTGADDR